MENSKIKCNPSVGKLIGAIARTAHIYFQQQFKSYSIGYAQVMTLHFVSRRNGINQLELTHLLNLDKSSITSQLNSLEKNGYIIRVVSDDDARVRKIYITDKTRAIEESIHKVFNSWSEVLLQGFSDAEQKNIFLLLEKMLGNAHNKIEEIKQDGKKK